MQVTLAVFLSAVVGHDGRADPVVKHSASTAGPRIAVGTTTPLVAFEIREIRFASPDWRVKLMPRLETVARQEGAAVWAVDEPAFKELLDLCQSDARGRIVSAPTMTVPVGKPARMTNEETIKYVASLKRHADGPAGQATRIAFEPQVDEIHSGVRVNVESSHLKGKVLFARVVIAENRLVKLHATQYSEPFLRKVEVESHEGSGLLHDRLHRSIGLERQVINASFQIPEVESRRAEGEWLIPSSGALLVSMGPRTRPAGLKTDYEEHLIAITARPVTTGTREDPALRQTAGTRKLP